MLTCKIALPDSSHQVITEKNGFQALHLAGRNEFRVFRMLRTDRYTFFFIFGCWLRPEKFSVCPKKNGFARLGGGGLQLCTPWLVRLFKCIDIIQGGPKKVNLLILQ